ncbi:PQQ-dependent sugar dehydrogenase [Opitutus terrae]|uniref:Cytochrome c class I n=1 Tax=Opitutus terrae (strain DSM 11246 / JCM 15787 / PB90-1) TaxID=452637 RepID=B1ZWJ5_OPITP|nr:c-type cytochrome [Opitutus terrae]ACB73319.1 cytochrome c class I [Opitutus terrae PB90-1]
MQHFRYGLALSLLSVAAHAASMPNPDADNGGLTLPSGFRGLIVADDLMAGRGTGNAGDALRFLAVTPEGAVYAKTSRGGILALRDADGDGRFEQKQEFGSGGGTGIAVHDGWLYHSTDSAVYRYKLEPGQLVPTGEPQLIVSGLPNEFSHTSKAFAFDSQGRLLVETGSPHNVYSDGDRQLGAKGKDPTEYLKTHGGFWRFDPEKQNQKQSDGFHFSTGHRHSLAIAWQPVAKEFFMVMMGRDGLNTVAPDYYDTLDNAERVAEEMHRLKEGVNLGWPFTYWDPYKKARMINPEFGGDGRKRAEVGKYDEPLIAFPAHWAPLQMQFYTGTQFPERYRGGAFVAFHGSWNRAPLPQDGFNVCFVPFDAKGAPLGSYEVFAANAGPQRFRMGGVAVGPDGSLYISETDRGRIWRIMYVGEQAGTAAPAATVAAGAVKPAPASANAGGRQLYEQLCASCHMPDGSGAGAQQPPLAGSKVVSGNPEQLIAVVLHGPAEVLPPDRPKYGNVMPSFAVLGNQQVADLLSYVREVFGNRGTPVTPANVEAIRQQR